MKEELFNEQNLERKFKCNFCQQLINESSKDLFYNSTNNNIIEYFHEECYKNNNTSNNNIFHFNKLNINDEKYKLYESHKKKIMNKLENDNILDKELSKYLFFDLDNKFKKMDINLFIKGIEKLKKSLLKNKAIKIKLIGKKLKQYQELIKDNNIEKKKKEWMKNWKEKINKYFKDNEKNIKRWIILKSSKINNDKKKKNLVFLNYEYKELKKKKMKLIYIK